MNEQRIREIVREEIAAIREEERRRLLESIDVDLSKRLVTKDIVVKTNGLVLGQAVSNV